MLDGIDAKDPLQLDDMPDAASQVHVTVERLFRLLKAQMSATLEARGSSIVEWRVLLMLRIHGEMAQKELVREVAMVQAQVRRTLSQMRRRNLVRARRSPADGRIWLFRLSTSGEALYRRIAPSMAARKHLLDSALSAEELGRFQAAARSVAEVLVAQGLPLQPE